MSAAGQTHLYWQTEEAFPKKKKNSSLLLQSRVFFFFFLALPQDKLETLKMNIAVAQENRGGVGFLTACDAGWWPPSSGVGLRRSVRRREAELPPAMVSVATRF